MEGWQFFFYKVWCNIIVKDKKKTLKGYTVYNRSKVIDKNEVKKTHRHTEKYRESLN